jgi:hypothetical protein
MCYLQASIEISAVSDLFEAPETSESDLVPGKYEGDGQILTFKNAACCSPDASGCLVVQTMLQQDCLASG